MSYKDSTVKKTDNHTDQNAHQQEYEQITKQMIQKEAKIKTLEKEKRDYMKEINHIKRSKTWSSSKGFYKVHHIFNRLLGRTKRIEQIQYMKALEEELETTKEILYQTKEKLREVRLKDPMLNTFKIQDFIRNLQEKGELVDFLDNIIEDKKAYERNYNYALIYIARLFMNEQTEYRHFIYSKILSALKTEDIPEFMLREGLIEDSQFSLQQVSSFRASLSMRLRQKQLVGQLPEFILEDKLDAYHFIEYLNIQKPKIYSERFIVKNMPQQENVVIKPIDGAGARGVYLVYDFNDIIDINRSRKLSSWEELEESMKEDLQSGRVSEDLWFMEELILEDYKTKKPARDLKFYCFYGKVGVILEISRYPERKHCWWTAEGDRIRTGKYEEDLFDGEGASIEEIKKVERLSSKIPVPFIRIDFLMSENELVFGEFTAKPGNYDEFDDQTDKWLGDYYLEAEARLNADLMKGKQFDDFNEFVKTLGYAVKTDS